MVIATYVATFKASNSTPLLLHICQNHSSVHCLKKQVQNSITDRDFIHFSTFIEHVFLKKLYLSNLKIQIVSCKHMAYSKIIPFFLPNKHWQESHLPYNHSRSCVQKVGANREIAVIWMKTTRIDSDRVAH